ncbi:MAG TPA: chalcone isomerase family protein [Mariprofundaceae bacterium]|nr:chalcone isomerase family protein [Mariprofundaceae bacterium]
MRKSLLFALILLGMGCTGAVAAEVDGIVFPPQVQLAGRSLVLNGAGIRTKFFLHIYAAALYTEHTLPSADAVLADGGAKRIVMHFIYDGVSQKRLAEGWNDGFEKNQDKAAMAALRPRLERFNAMFREAHRDDVYRFDLLPDGTTGVFLNGQTLGRIEGADFQRALLCVWLGTSPADADLKRALLGRP